MNKTIGEKIKHLRLQANLSQEELADKLYFSNRTISNWENNLREVSIGNLQRIADFFTVPITFFTNHETLNSMPANDEAKKTYQNIVVKNIAVNDRFFYVLIAFLCLNSLMVFVPFLNRLNAGVIILVFWIGLLVLSIVRYTALDRARMRHLLVPLNHKVYFQSALSFQDRRRFKLLSLLYYILLTGISLFYYGGVYHMINSVEPDFLFTALITMFFMFTTALQGLVIFRLIFSPSQKDKIPYQRDNNDLGMILHRSIVTVHYVMIIFIVILIASYGHLVFPFDLLFFNLFIGLFLVVLLRLILLLNAKYYRSFQLYSENPETKTQDKLA
jgi:transcriptional regulator with XRE-family HTH domain